MVRRGFGVICTIVLLAIALHSGRAEAGATDVTVGLSAGKSQAELPSRYMGLSYESSMLLPVKGKYYFNAKDAALVQMFKTLGIKSLRVGANAVDDPRVDVPQEKDIDELFAFARAADVKVIYSFRLKDGNPAESARLASYISAHYSDLLDSFSIGNEPNFYLKSYDKFLPAWKPHYDAILKALPNAPIEGPSSTHGKFLLDLAHDLFSQGHLSMLTDHYYFLGSGRAGEKDPPATRAKFMSNDLLKVYQETYAKTAAVLQHMGVPYRIDEMNSCFNGGAKDASDTYASTIWALDCIHWWAAKHIVGMNFHTGELVGRDKEFGAPNYAAFLRTPDHDGFAIRPQGYAYLAFTQGAHGRAMDITCKPAKSVPFNVYGYQDQDGTIYVTLINKTYGDNATSVRVKLELPANSAVNKCQKMDLIQKQNDIAAKTDVTFGGSGIDTHGVWAGQWQNAESPTGTTVNIDVPAASATILKLSR